MHENNGKPEALLWIDFETTGVDRRKSLPLEIGMECTDMLGEQKFGSLSRIIRPDRLASNVNAARPSGNAPARCSGDSCRVGCTS